MVTKVQNSNVQQSVAVPNLVSSSKRPARDSMSSIADVVSNDGKATIASVSEAAPATGPNPFISVMSAAVDVNAPVLKIADANDATSESCEPELPALLRLTAIEGRLVARDNQAGGRVRNGMMQITYDAQEERGLDRDGSERLARLLAEPPRASTAKDVLHAQEWKAAVGTYYKGGDVNAFVQSVLRESYLLSNLDLQMYADKVKALNELRKKIREEAQKARQMKTEWMKAAGDNKEWVAPYSYAPVTTDMSRMGLRFDVYSQQEIDELNGAQQGAMVPKDGAEPGSASASKGDFWSGDSWLSDSLIASYADVKTDDIRNHKPTMDQIKAAIPKMSEADIRKYILPLLENFKKHGHEGGILELVQEMSPEQRLVVAASGFGSDSSAFGGVGESGFGYPGGGKVDYFTPKERALYNSLLVDAVNALMPGRITELGKGVTTAQAKQYMAEYKSKLSQQSAPTSQASANAATPENPSADGKKAGDKKLIDTIEGLDSYIKNLEDQMNSVGDDAQLANIDLQNCLQKQQQTLQMMSNISKMMHDVAMSIIRNMNS